MSATIDDTLHRLDVNAAHQNGARQPVIVPYTFAPTDRPEVVLSGDLEQRAQILLERLSQAHTTEDGPRLYVRGRDLVRVAPVKRGKMDRKGRPGTVIEVMTQARLRTLLVQSYSLVTNAPPNDVSTALGAEATERKPCIPSNALLDQILHRAEWPDLPVLDRIVRVPGLGPGEWITSDGYNAELAAWVDLQGLELPISPRPTAKDVRAAVELLCKETLGDFPFASQADLANALGLLIAPLVRHSIDDNMPLFMVSAAMERTGKTLLTDVLGAIATGNPPMSSTERHGEEEWRKAITAALHASPAIFRLDNLARRLDSPAIASLLTARRWSDRMLGRNDVQIDLPNDVVICATANNPRMSAEIRGRTILIRLETPCERPDQRSDFQHDDLLVWVQDNRPRLLGAALTLVSNWLAQGKPLAKARLGGFNRAVAVIGGILQAAGVAGWMGNVEALRAAADDSTATIDAITTAWHAKFGSAEVTAKRLFETVTTDPDLMDLVAPVLGDGDQHSRRIRLGRALGQWIGRIHCGFRVERGSGDARNKVQTYRLRRV